MRLRSIREAERIIRNQDENSGVSINCIRNLVRCGKVHYIKSGRKVLLDVDDLLRQLSGEQTKEKD